LHNVNDTQCTETISWITTSTMTYQGLEPTISSIQTTIISWQYFIRALCGSYLEANAF